MGVIQRQGLKHTIVNMVGLGIGAVSTLYVYPHVLEGYGLFQLLLSVGTVGLSIFSLGANVVSIRYFPQFQDKASGHHGFLRLLLTLCLIGSSTTALLAWIFWDFIQIRLTNQSPILTQHLWVAVPLASLYVINATLSTYSANFKRIVVPTILLDFSQKLVLPFLLILTWHNWITLDQAVLGLLIHATLVLIGMLLYLKSQGHLHLRSEWSFITPTLRRDMMRFIGFGAFGGFALLMATKSDLFVVGALRPLNDAGVYAMAMFFAGVIEVPVKSLYAASASSVTRHLADKNYAELGQLYKKVSINLLCAGLLLFGSIWISIDQLYLLMPNSEIVSAGKWVFFFIGISRLIDMATGLNNYLIYYSEYYMWSLFSLGISSVCNIAFAIWLVPIFGIEGAAIAAVLSIASYNTFTVLLVLKKFRLQPFTPNTFYVLLLGIVSYAIVVNIPSIGWPLFDLMVHAGLFALLFVALLLRLRISPDLNDLFKTLKSLKNPLF